MKYKFNYLFALAFLIFNWSIPAQAEQIQCDGAAPYSGSMTMRVELASGKDGKVTLLYPSGQHYLSWSLGSKYFRRFNGKKITYADHLSSSGWSLQINSPAIEGNNLIGKLDTSIGDIGKVNLTCAIIGQASPALPFCKKAKPADLIRAINSGTLEDISSAIDCGSDVNFVDKRGCSAILYALDSGCGTGYSDSGPRRDLDLTDAVGLLLDSGANMESVDPSTKETALLKAARFGDPSIIDLLKDLEANFNVQDEKGFSALMRAAEADDMSTMFAVLDGEPNRSLKNKKGQTAFDIAKARGFSDILEDLEVASSTVVISGDATGSCSPSAFAIKLGESVEITLKASDRMLSLIIPDFGVDLMAASNSSLSKIIKPQKIGKFAFKCGPHGAPDSQQTQGMVTVQ
jgi:hypothetical protein